MIYFRKESGYVRNGLNILRCADGYHFCLCIRWPIRRQWFWRWHRSV